MNQYLTLNTFFCPVKFMKTNFRDEKPKETVSNNTEQNENKKFTKEEWEAFVIKSGAKGSFMIYRSQKKDEELGLDEL